MRARGIPYIVKGMSGLFETPEVVAAAGIFQYMSRGIEADVFLGLWRDAQLGLTEAELGRGLGMLAERREFEPNKQFSVYSLQRTYLDFLEEVGLRGRAGAEPAGRSGVLQPGKV